MTQSDLSIQNDVTGWDELQYIIEVTDIPGENRKAKLLSL